MIKIVTFRVACFFWLILVASSCGFTPVYGTASKASAAFADLVVAPPEGDRANYLFVVAVENRVGRNPAGSKLLQYDIFLTETGLNSEGQRFQLIGRVNYKIVSLEDSRLLFEGSQDSFVTFSADGILLTSKTQNARERLMSILADKVTAELMIAFSKPLVE